MAGTRSAAEAEITADYGIVTALGDEMEAVLSVLASAGALERESIHSGQKDIRYYHRASVPSEEGDLVTIICACAPEMGQLPAVNITRDVISTWRPRHLLLVGIAGGIGARSIGYGDVIAPLQVHYYEPAKLLPAKRKRGGRRQLRWQTYRTSAMLQEAVKILALDQQASWVQRISIPRPDTAIDTNPRVFQDELASGEEVWADLDADMVRDVLDRSDKILAVDNEAAGFLRAVHESPHKPEAIVIKAVSDLVAQKDDTWRSYAARAAAAFAVALIQKVGSRWTAQDSRPAASDEGQQRFDAAKQAFNDDLDFEKAARLFEQASELAAKAGNSELEREAQLWAVRAWAGHLVATSMENGDRQQVISFIEQHLAAAETLGASATELAVEKARLAQFKGDDRAALRWARKALRDAELGSTTWAEALILYQQACWQLGKLKNALQLAHKVEWALSAVTIAKTRFCISATWLCTLCKARKAKPSDVEGFCTLVRDFARQGMVNDRYLALVTDEVASEFKSAGALNETLALCELRYELAERLADAAMCCSIALQAAEVAAEANDENRSHLFIGKANSWLERVKSSNKDTRWPTLRAAWLFTKGRTILRLTEASNLTGEPLQEKLMEAYDVLREAKQFGIDNRGLLEGDVEILLADVNWWLGRIAFKLHRWEEATPLFKAVRSESAMAHPSFSKDAGMPAWFLEAETLVLAGRLDDASRVVRALIDDPRAADSVGPQAQALNEYLETRLLPIPRWLVSPEAQAIAEIAQRRTVREAVAEQLAPLVSWWNEWQGDESAPESELLDFWGRGGFSRLAAAIRAKPFAVVAVDARSTDEIRHLARMLCPIFDTVVVKWKGDLWAGIVMAPLRKEYGGAGSFGGHGYIVTATEVREHWAAAMAWANPLPREVTAFLASEALPLVASGRLVVLPAPLVGCTQSAVGWTDNLLLDAFLGGVVDVVRKQHSEPRATQRILDLSEFSIPYIEDVELGKLAQVLVEIGEWLRPLQSLLLKSIDKGDLRYERWQSIRALDNDIQDACKQLQEHLDVLARKQQWHVAQSRGSLSAASHGGHVEAHEPVSDLLRGLASERRELAPWIPYWRLETVGGRLDWTRPIDNPSKPSPDPRVPKELHSWLYPGTGGWGVRLVRGPS